ncbi:hypothetical protein DB346_15190 [Verrucomicrobia bacterium LW23]|nr:hypothetical protein DB346_15190 [Verrucomicrobia bacterium LW23]
MEGGYGTANRHIIGSASKVPPGGGWPSYCVVPPGIQKDPGKPLPALQFEVTALSAPVIQRKEYSIMRLTWFQNGISPLVSRSNRKLFDLIPWEDIAESRDLDDDI